MLLEYSVDNFRSFKDEAFLELRPTKTKAINRFPNSYVTLGTGEKVLKDLVIVGENAGGKSNFVESLGFLRDLFVRMDVECHSYTNTVNSSNLVLADDGSKSASLEKSNTTQAFSIEVALDDATYSYFLKIDGLGVLEEKLSYRKKRTGQSNTVFEQMRTRVRTCASCDAASDCDKGAGSSNSGCLDYSIEIVNGDGPLSIEEMERLYDVQGPGRRPILSWLSAIGELHCRCVVDWIVDDLVVAYGPSGRLADMRVEPDDLFSLMASEEYLSIVQLIDGSIVGIIPDRERPFMESVVVRENASGKRFNRQVKDDSAGVRQFLAWSVYIYQVVYQGKTVVADEVDSLINPMLSDKVIAFINGSDHHGQFIFTTHNIFNLTLRTYMKEQIYIVSKDSETLESSLYSVADFDEIRYDVKEELYEFYLKGMLGGTVNA